MKDTTIMITCAQVTKPAIQFHYDLGTLFYRLLWGRHIHHGLWEERPSLSPYQAQVRLIERLAGAAAIETGARVLDVGCGMGGSSIYLARQRHCQVTGMTLSPVQRLWAQTSAWLGGVGRRTRFLCRDAERAEFEPGSFDVIWSVECTEHLFDKPRFFEQAAGWLKPGGRVAICAWLAGPEPSTLAADKQVFQVCKDFLCPSLGTAEDYQGWMRSAGLDVLESADLTQFVTRTWEICLKRATWPGIQTLARLAGTDMNRFVNGFAEILEAFRSGAMRYGCIVAQAPR